MGSEEEEEEEEEDQEQEDWLKKHANGLNFVIVIGGNCDGATMQMLIAGLPHLHDVFYITTLCYIGRGRASLILIRSC